MTKRHVPRPSAAALRARRKATRAGTGRPSEYVIKPGTLKRYLFAVNLFFRWCSAYERPLPSSVELFDRLVSEYVDEAYEEGEAKSVVADVISGLQHYVASLHHRLHGSWRLYRAWDKREIPLRCRPLWPEEILGIAGVLYMWAAEDAALVVCLIFHLLLRSAEAFSLQKRHFALLSSGRGGIVVLEDTKTGGRKGEVETVSFADDRLALWCAAVLNHLDPGDRLLRRSQAQFRLLFASAVDFLELPGFVRPYSARRGGATWDFRQHGLMSVTQDRGRWNSQAAARIYVNLGVADLAATQLEEATRERCVNFAQVLPC